MEYIRLGQIKKSRGLQGELVVYSMTDFAKQRFKKGNKISFFNEKKNQRVEMTVKAYTDSGDYYYLKVEEINRLEEAEAYYLNFVEIDKEAAPLPKDTYRYADLIGSTLIDKETRQAIGQVSDVLSYAPTKTLRCTREGGKDFFVPFNKVFIGEVDVEKKTIEVNVIEGLL